MKWDGSVKLFKTGHTFKERNTILAWEPTLGHEAWVEGYFRPKPDSFDAQLSREFPCYCWDCEGSRNRKERKEQ